MSERLLVPSRPVSGGRDLDLPGAGVRLSGTRWSGTGTPVLLLHGLASQRRFWNLVVPGLVGLPLLALDARGHGDSDKPDPGEAGGYTGATVVADIVTTLDAMAWSRAVVVGHSWGGSVALQLAANHPDRALAVVCIDGGFSRPTGDRSEVLARLAPPRMAAEPEDIVAMMRASPLAPWWSPAVEEAGLPIFAVGADGLARARLTYERHMAIVAAMLDEDPAQWYPHIGVPTWLLSAEPIDEEHAREGQREWQEAKRAGIAAAVAGLAQPRVLRVQGALHDVPLQWPALIAGLIRGAVDEVSPG